MQRRKVVLIFGKTGSGKTTLAKSLMKAFTRVVIFDPLAEYPGLVVSSFEDFCELHLEEREEFHVVCRFASADDFDTEAMYDYTARALWHIGNLLLLCEETELFLNSSNRSSYINHLINFGRHKEISIIGVGRRPSDIAIKLRAQCTSVVSFTQNEPRDLQYLQAWGFDSEELVTLPEHTYSVLGEAL